MSGKVRGGPSIGLFVAARAFTPIYAADLQQCIITIGNGGPLFGV